MQPTEKVNTVMGHPPDISIIVEWENIVFSKDSRCAQMLSKLREQIADIDRTSEVIVLFNPEQFDRSSIASIFGEHFSGDPQIPLRIEAARTLHYYDLKNLGASMAAGEIVVYIDSDALPEKNWLAGLTDPFFNDDEIKVLAGNTYLSHASIYEKAFALGWFFPLRETDNNLSSDGQSFFANNVAFRRRTILERPFPPLPGGMTRGSCLMLARNLTGSGISIWKNTASRVCHPPPAGIRHYLVRALAQGRDFVLISKEFGSTGSSVKKGFQYSWNCFSTMVSKVKQERQVVDLSAWQVPLALSVMAGYYGLVFVGSCLTTWFPGYAANHWRI